MQIVDPFWFIDDGATVTTNAELLDWWHAYYSLEPWRESSYRPSGKQTPDQARDALDALF